MNNSVGVALSCIGVTITAVLPASGVRISPQAGGVITSGRSGSTTTRTGITCLSGSMLDSIPAETFQRDGNTVAAAVATCSKKLPKISAAMIASPFRCFKEVDSSQVIHEGH